MQNNSEHNGLIGSLFSGYGGLDLGVDMALGGGMRVAYTSDIEPGPCAIESYHAHGDDCPNLGDITGIDFEKLPDTDVVVGGSPCQSLSLAGLRAGMHEGTRSGLWSYQADILKASKSPLLLWENVQGALTATASSREDLAEADRRAKALGKAGLCACVTPSVDPPDGFTPPDPDAEGAKPLATVLRDYLEADPEKCAAVVCKACGRHVFEINGDTVLADGERLDGVHTAPTIRALGRVLGDLANLGYDAVWRGLEAADIGAPHHRLRIFVTAWPRDPSTAREPSNARLRRLAQLPPMRPKGRAWAVWDADRDVWTTGEPDLFGDVDVYMDAWPKSGVMAAGRVYMVPGSWLTVPVPAAGSALATPKATDGAKGGPNQSYGNGDAPLPAQAAMLPTIKAGDAGHTGPNQRFGAGNPSLAASVAGIGVLPTPNVSDAVPADGFLYTPKQSDGVFAAPATSGRPLDRSTFLSTQVRLMDLPGRMDPEKVMEHDSRLPTPRANDADGAGVHGDGGGAGFADGGRHAAHAERVVRQREGGHSGGCGPSPEAGRAARIGGCDQSPVRPVAWSASLRMERSRTCRVPLSIGPSGPA